MSILLPDGLVQIRFFFRPFLKKTSSPFLVVCVTLYISRPGCIYCAPTKERTPGCRLFGRNDKLLNDNEELLFA
jgi:hypothetical protein